MKNHDYKNNTFVVIPTYNHSATVKEVLRKALCYHPNVLIVDDGSTDDLARTVKDFPVEIIQHSRNLGKGAALRTAAQWGLQQGMSHMISIDSDGQHYPEDLPKFFSAIDKCPRSLIIGHRDFKQTSIPKASRFGRSFSNFWLWVHTGKRTKDTQCGFRAYPLRIFQEINFLTSRYNFEIEVLVRSAWAGVELRDVDISVHYPPNNERISHFRCIMDNYRLTVLNTYLTFLSLIPFKKRTIKW